MSSGEKKIKRSHEVGKVYTVHGGGKWMRVRRVGHNVMVVNEGGEDPKRNWA